MNIRRVPWTDVIITAIGLSLCALLLTACSETREEKHEEKKQERQVEQTTTTTVTTPIVADTMAGQVTVQPIQVTQTVKRERTTDTNTNGEIHEVKETPVPPVVAQSINAAAGGLGTLLPGGGIVASLAFGAWQMLKNRQTTGALQSVVSGIQEAKDSMPAEQVELLHTALAKAMDDSHKKIVRSLKD